MADPRRFPAQQFSRMHGALLIAALAACGCAPAVKSRPAAAATPSGEAMPSNRAALAFSRPVSVTRDTTSTVCVPVSALEAQAGAPRAFFGFHADACDGAVAGDPTKRLTVTGYDELRGRSPARDAGILIGDIIVGINGCAMLDLSELRQRMRQFRAGGAAEFTVLRKSDGRYLRHDLLVPTIELRSRTSARASCAAFAAARRSPIEP